MPRRSDTLRRHLGWILAVPVALLALTNLSPGIQAQSTQICTATLSGAQENPPVATAATGSGTIDFVGFAANGNTIVSVNLTFQSLSSTQVDSHIHGPAAPGVNAGVIIQLNSTAPTVNQMVELTSTQRTILAGNMAYFNVHTANFGAGEIRGQISCNAFPEQPAATATPTLTGTPVPTSTVTSTPTVTSTATVTPTSVSGFCSPRPNVRVVARPGLQGGLQASVFADSSAGTPNNTLRSIRFRNGINARIDIAGQTGRTGEFTIDLPAGTNEIGFVVRRVTDNQATTLPLTVVDACGEWPTFVGGGPNAF